jgi:DNA adenine methylase
MEHLVDRVVMADIDPDISVVWNVILRGDHEALSRRITGFEISREAVIHQLSNPPKSDLDRAFNTILRNRVQRGGILAPGASLVRSGENGKGVASRWYPTTLARRIEAIASVRERIEFVSADGLDLICSLTEDPEVVFFVDPPYTAGGKKAGKRLYAFNELDHSRLFALLGQSKGPALITYDDAPEPLLLAQSHGFSVERTAMSNTHHSTMLELLITSPGRPHPATA